MPRRTLDDFTDDEFDTSIRTRRQGRRSNDLDFEDDDLAPVRALRKKLGRTPRNEQDQAFKCGHCRSFIGAPLTGGRNRNHCPNCLYSKHVDLKRPGDRLCECGSLMAPVGLFARPNGEEMILHRCLGCGFERPNRVAADDNPGVLEALPYVDPPQSGRQQEEYAERE